MPIISHFYGILIYIYREIGTSHNKPHIHAKYNDYEMCFILDSNKREGNMPSKQKKNLLRHGLKYIKRRCMLRGMHITMRER